jgi:hypothetical protein
MTQAHRRALAAIGLATSLALVGACAELDDLQKQAAAYASSHPASAPPPQSSSGDGAQPAANPGGGGSNTWCCVNQEFYDCQTSDRAVKCMGNPMALMDCSQKCKGDGGCAIKCMGDYGPSASRGPCDRTPARDGECPKQ